MQFLKSLLHKKAHAISEKGFTLIEIITVIVLLGIIGVMGSEIITNSFRGFAQTDDAMELFEEGKLALMRMEREIHHMIPNSIDNPSDATDIHFGLIDVNTLNSIALPITGQYTPVGGSDKIRDLSSNMLPVGSTLLSIYNTNWTYFQDTNDAIRKIYGVTQINTPPGSMKLSKGVIGGHSATMRYYPISDAVRYYLDGTGTMLFRSETPITLAPDDFMTTLDAAPHAVLLSNIQLGSLRFNYSPPSLTSNALVRVDFSLTRNGTTLNFHKEIQVRNVP
ncbi:MAG: type II secretion system GspH family protein [Proteobacteria bacterium]|nr:type II secretion system GspH family protein [Pseudomonadota bacterium]MBU1640226.1 type II secretion system GspH family protein [Pseudomonadota bacterium]